MRERSSEKEQTPEETSGPGPGRKAGLVAVAVLLCAALLPGLLILLGVGVVALVGLSLWHPLQGRLQQLLRVPVARAGERHARLALIAGAGLLLVVSGAMGATARGLVRSKWELRQGRRAAAEDGVAGLLARARSELAQGDVAGAEFVLMNAEGFEVLDDKARDQLDELLGRVRRSGDRGAILEILTELPESEFDALRRGSAVPEALEFGERALNLQALELAMAQLDQAQLLRARR